MNFKYTFGILTLFSLIFTSCSSDIEEIPDIIGPEPDVLEDELPDSSVNYDSEAVYSIISLNVHDWVNPEESATTINKVIDLHEEYEIPVGIYLTEMTFRNYVEMGDELVERLTSSEYVEVGYHLRPPHPAYSGFDYFDMNEMSTDELYDFLYEYETKATDLVTGETTSEAGGMQFITDTLGEAPIIAGMGSAAGNIKEILADVFMDIGATLTVGRGGVDLGSESFGFLVRPEHYDLKLYEHVMARSKGGESIEEMLEEAVAGLSDSKDGPQFLGIKYHENNFYLTGTPFAPCYWEDGGSKQIPFEPPYDLELCYEGEKMRPISAQNEHWDLYEATLQYLDEHREEFNPIGLEDVVNMM
jgi:hypothetical protein